MTDEGETCDNNIQSFDQLHRPKRKMGQYTVISHFFGVVGQKAQEISQKKPPYQNTKISNKSLKYHRCVNL
jgi:hypothetical protein